MVTLKVLYGRESMANVDRKPNSQDRIQGDSQYAAFSHSSHSLLTLVVLKPTVSAAEVGYRHGDTRHSPLRAASRDPA